ncbi:LON peptidase substrate-binding domain-containing protein [Vibrio salinus]|uniref:LON peptidase substrate-binding domain-containing protein n=1 Tax=Vibrio salinus TaxID=2899784 RepID=UPI001E3EB82C|nr:LON peptidase substrate-binding domain-containing protein [Vibrio salinus]MCE0494346.1 LON peptidase substrate-binding domain-containing protein [Vibrio salinus]
MEDIMLFPLGSIVLPEGKMKLRIFEPRYRRMLSECGKQGKGFGICLFDSKAPENINPLSEYGCYVKVVDFKSLSDGILGITVSGMKRFKIIGVRKESDNLRIASVEWVPNWEYVELGHQYQSMADKLQEIYRQFPEIGNLYQQRFLDDLSWVTQRWLELIPLSNQQFDDLNEDFNCCKSVGFIHNALEHIKI